MVRGKLRLEPVKVLGRSMKYLDILSLLDPEYLYSASSVSQVAATSGLIDPSLDREMRQLYLLRIRVTMGRLSNNHCFPLTGDGLLPVKGRVTMQGWFGWRWQAAARIAQMPETPARGRSSRTARATFKVLAGLAAAVFEQPGNGADLMDSFLQEAIALGLKPGNQVILPGPRHSAACLVPALRANRSLALFVRVLKEADPHAPRLLHSYLLRTRTTSVALVDLIPNQNDGWRCYYLDGSDFRSAAPGFKSEVVIFSEPPWELIVQPGREPFKDTADPS